MRVELRKSLDARDVACTEMPNGDFFFRRRDGQGMYVRPHPDGTYDWSVNAAENHTNLMDFRAPERHELAEVLGRVEDFLDSVVSGRVVIDTLGLVQGSVALGMSVDEAERFAETARGFVIEMHESGMDAHEIKTRFDEIHEQLRRERVNQPQASAG